MTVVDNTVQTVCGSTERLPVRRFHCNYMQMWGLLFLRYNHLLSENHFSLVFTQLSLI